MSQANAHAQQARENETQTTHYQKRAEEYLMDLMPVFDQLATQVFFGGIVRDLDARREARS